MIFVFAEDGTLHVAADLAEVRRLCEPIDVESGVFTFFDAEGRPLTPLFTRPNRETRVLGLLTLLDQGEYVLGPGADAAHDPIGVALAEAADLAPNPWFSSLPAVREYLSGRGCL